jgi:hypothetical protein
MHWEFSLSLIAALILTVGLIYTARLAKRQRYQGEYDTEISERVQAHPVTRNPVFLTYLVALVLVILYIIYFAVSG